MKDDNKQRLEQDLGEHPGFGDDQGTRVGSPTPASSRRTGAGAEAAEGMHAADGERSPTDRSALEGKSAGRGSSEQGDDRAGSEPIESHDTEHRSKYGGGSRREDDAGQRPA
jgi:hypothetical protein